MTVPVRVLLAAYWLLVLVLAGVICLVGLLIVVAAGRVQSLPKSAERPRRGIAPPVRWPEKVGTDWQDEEGDVTPEGLGPRVLHRAHSPVIPKWSLDESARQALYELERERQP